MGNDLSSTSARTLIPLDDAACWQLYNGTNERSEAISIFVAKQTFSVECRRSIQFLKTIRHPNIIKFFNGFKTFVDQDSFIADCVHPLANKLTNQDIDSTAKLCLGLYHLSQALEFLHEKAYISHNNVCLLSLYISLNGIWKLGNFECACRYDNLNKKYLSSLKLIRWEECITPEEDEKSLTEINKQDIYAIDMYGFGTLIRHLITIVSVDDELKNLLDDLQISLTDEEPQSRPKWSALLQTQLFQIDYIKATEVLDRLPTVETSDLDVVVESLSTYLDNLNSTYFNELLIRRLFVPFMFLCSSTRSKIIPRILIPKEDDANSQSWIPVDKYRTYVIPLIVDLFSYHVTCIRETLLEYYNSYWQLIDRTTLINVILPQLVYGLKDSSNSICTLTLLALAAMVPVIGAEIVIGGQRKQIFTDKLKKENVSSPKLAKAAAAAATAAATSVKNSPVATPTSSHKIRKSSPSSKTKANASQVNYLPTPTPQQTKPSLVPPKAPSEHTNGYHLPTNISNVEPSDIIIQNGVSDSYHESEIEHNDGDDDGQWSDWEHNPDPPELPDVFLPEEPIQPVTTILPSSTKSLKLNHISKPKWNPDAPLGSEYEIPSIVQSTNKSKKDDALENQESEDFFKDMMPKVQTVQLMTQLETMFNLNSEQPKAEKKSTDVTSSFSNKFGIMQPDHEDNQEIESGNNNWDE